MPLVTPALTPDFDVHAADVAVAAAATAPAWVEVTWAGGGSSRYHHVWLRDNCPCPLCVHQVTKEQTFELGVDDEPQPVGVAVTDGGVAIDWADGHRSEYHPGWLWTLRYDPAPAGEPAPVAWDASTPGMPATFDGPAVLADDDALHDWLVALRHHGLTVLRDVPLDLDAVGRVAERIGPVRATNFGVLWDVRSEPEPITNANTSFALPPHVDLPTREYQPGLQLLHCIKNTCAGGDGRYLDGFRVSEILRDEEPGHFEVLTTVPCQWANRSKVTDHRWSAPAIGLDHAGQVREIRMGNWLRGPLAVEFDRVEVVYAATRAMAAVARREGMAIRLPLRPGDLVAFDNRRILHGRDAFDADGGGTRLLRGCYGERDELRSRLRILDRERRRASTPMFVSPHVAESGRVR